MHTARGVSANFFEYDSATLASVLKSLGVKEIVANKLQAEEITGSMFDELPLTKTKLNTLLESNFTFGEIETLSNARSQLRETREILLSHITHVKDLDSTISSTESSDSLKSYPLLHCCS
jgi:hypothetical protein